MTIMVISRNPTAPRRVSSPLREGKTARILCGSGEIAQQSVSQRVLERADHVTVDPENERRVLAMAARWERLAAAYPHPDAIPMTLTIMDDLPDPLPPPIPMPVEEVPEDELCCHPGCVRRAKSRGSLCAGHIWRQRNGRDMDAPFSVPESGRGKLRMRDATDTCRRCLTVAWRVRADGYLECGECDRRRGRRKA